jgi:glycerate kinase
MSHVVVAPDKFKGTLTATQVASHVAAGFARVRPDLAAVQVPVADGGDGTVDAAEAAGYRRVEIGVRGPTGKPVNASFALLDEIAVGLGGVACTDGGAGLVTALGGRLLDSSGNELPPGGAALATLDRVDVRCSTCSRSPATCPEHAWSSPGKAPSTSRRCTGRRPPGSRAPRPEASANRTRLVLTCRWWRCAASAR